LVKVPAVQVERGRLGLVQTLETLEGDCYSRMTTG